MTVIAYETVLGPARRSRRSTEQPPRPSSSARALICSRSQLNVGCFLGRSEWMVTNFCYPESTPPARARARALTSLLLSVSAEVPVSFARSFNAGGSPGPRERFSATRFSATSMGCGIRVATFTVGRYFCAVNARGVQRVAPTITDRWCAPQIGGVHHPLTDRFQVSSLAQRWSRDFELGRGRLRIKKR